MKIGHTMNVDNYRRLVHTYIDLHLYNSALFWADKIVALTGNLKDIYWLAQCMYLLKQYHRAVHLLTSRDLLKKDIIFMNIAVRCLYEANELNEALNIVNSVEGSLFDMKQNMSMGDAAEMDESIMGETSKNQTVAAFLFLRGKVLEGMDNRGLAADCYKQALQLDVHCFEAFDSLIRNQMLTAAEEEELMKNLPIAEQCSAEEAEILQILYESKLKKYHTPILPKPNESRILFGNVSPKLNNRISSIISNSPQLLPQTPILNTPPTSTPDVTRNNDKNLKNDMKNKKIDESNSASLIKLKNSLDLQVAEAERLYYNCDYQQCSQLTEAILKVDPYHDVCLPIHISCQVELKQSNKLFSLAHNLVDLYPHLAISWFAVGCYYYIIGKSDFARRYLAKATSIDRLFGPAWLAYGHSFAIENEHDQAMAAYFKASQLMKSCHLPLLYIGLECGLTNNVRLADKFFQQAQNIAPDDPFIMHEKGVISFQNMCYEIAGMHFRNALERVKKIKNGVIPERWSPLLNNLGHACRKLKKYDEALSFHHQALLLNPHSAGTYSAIAYCHVLMGNNEQAVEWFHKALGLKRDDTFSTTMLNYIIAQVSEESAPYPDCPSDIPKFDLESKSLMNVTQQTGEVTESGVSGVNSEIVDMSMSM